MSVNGCIGGCGKGAEYGAGLGFSITTTAVVLTVCTASVAALVGGIKLLTIFKKMPNPQYVFWTGFTGAACVVIGGAPITTAIAVAALGLVSGTACGIPGAIIGGCVGSITGGAE